jgi:hypothetical protein
MSIARRILDAVTPRRILAALVIGGLAHEILPALRWLASTGRELGEVPALRGLLLAGAALALEVGLIYLALRGLRCLLMGRARGRPAIRGGTDREAADRPREGGGDDGDPDHR